MAVADLKKSQMIDGNAFVSMCLSRVGVDKMFGVVGIPVTSLANRAVALGIRFIAFHNEQSAGYAASAYGYLTGRPGILLTVSGPGCVHGLAGLSNAAANAWPMVLISGSSDQSLTGRGDFQELDQIAAVKPFSKFSAKATDITKIPESVFSVVDWAVAGRREAKKLELRPLYPAQQPLVSDVGAAADSSTSWKSSNEKLAWASMAESGNWENGSE